MKRFSTFEGVFTPSLLSILGVIMYLRLGWVVGQVGLAAALFIIVCSNVVTLATALSMSSVVTNIRIGTGGAYSIIAKSLGIEAGGAIGIPLYFSQAISVAFYVTGFTECWVSVFPAHNFLLVSLIVWFLLMVVSYWSASLAFRVQYLIMGVIVLSLVSIFLGGGSGALSEHVGENLAPEKFWSVFAIFFPAVTGVLAGAAMSGELKDPRRSIPLGTFMAIGVSFVVYMLLAAWFSRNASAAQLIGNTSLIIDLSRWKLLVVGGIMGATLSSGLSMFVTSPRTLMALGKHTVIPFSSSFARLNRRGEPSTAIVFTALISLVTLLLGSLDSVASLLTMFFLITYGMINISVFIEQSIGITSFRPSFRIPKIVSLFGAVACFGIMMLINAEFSLVALAVIALIYFILLRRELDLHSPDVRSGLFIFLAEKMALAASRLPYHPKIWKPNLLIPAEDVDMLKKIIPFIRSIVAPAGRIFCFRTISLYKDREVQKGTEDHTAAHEHKEKLRTELKEAFLPLSEEGLFVETSVVEAGDELSASIAVMQTLRDMVLPPNTLFYPLSNQNLADVDILSLVQRSAVEGFGIILLKLDEMFLFGEEKKVNLWIRQHSPNIDLSILVALQLQANWDGELRIVQAVSRPEEASEAEEYCRKVKKIMRLPDEVEIRILAGDFPSVLTKAPEADINIFGMPEVPDLQLVEDVFGALKTSVLFLRDSNHESAVA